MQVPPDAVWCLCLLGAHIFRLRVEGGRGLEMDLQSMLFFCRSVQVFGLPKTKDQRPKTKEALGGLESTSPALKAQMHSCFCLPLRTAGVQLCALVRGESGVIRLLSALLLRKPLWSCIWPSWSSQHGGKGKRKEHFLGVLMCAGNLNIISWSQKQS